MGFYRANRIADRFRNSSGHVVTYPKPGESFDEANDIHLTESGHITFRFEGFDPQGPVAGKLNASYGGHIFIGSLTDAVMAWERYKNPEEWREMEAEGPEEYGMLHGTDG